MSARAQVTPPSTPLRRTRRPARALPGLLLALLLAPSAARAAAAVPAVPAAAAAAPAHDEPRRIPPVDSAVYREVRSIPYPAGAIYLTRGITGSFLGGKYKQGDEKSLYQWQGELGYFYAPWFSGGVGFKINAGEPSDSAQQVINRYYIQGRFHFPFRRVTAYLGPQIGLENLNILSGTPDPEEPGKEISDRFKDTKASLGVEAGFGWKATRWGGLTLGTVSEYSFVDDAESDFEDNLNFRVNPGLAIDVLALTDTLRELVPALYVHMEFQLGFLIFQQKNRNNDQAFILGVGLAF